MSKIIPLKVMEPFEKYGTENAHDKLFKDLLDDETELKEFITQFIGINIQSEEIEKCNNSYITKQYKKYEADMVYKIKGEEVYILIEHQSTVDVNMPYRILNYYGEVSKAAIKEIEINVYPLIIPIVLYTGERNWKIETKYSKKVIEYKTSKKYIKLEYELVDINQYTEEELLEKNTLLAYAMLIEKNRGKEPLINILEKISVRCNTNKNKEKMQRIINYLLYPILEENTKEMIGKFKIEEEMDMKTAQDYIREEMRELRRKAIEEGLAEGRTRGREEGIKEGREEGRKEGRKEGKQEGKQEGIKEGRNSIIINMIKNKVKIEEIKKYTGVEEKEIEKIVANM